jgi:hypothetical protein
MGLTLQQYMKLWDACNGHCPLCGKQMGRARLPAVDHDHKTGRIRGLICAYCNTTLGELHDDAGWLARAADYLTNPPAVAIIGEHFVPGSRGAEQ